MGQMNEQTMNIIAVLNNKGGDGKTTVAVHVATGLAALGYRVVMIDLDSQGQVAAELGLLNPDGKPNEGVFNVLVNGHDIHEELIEVTLAKYQVSIPDYLLRYEQPFGLTGSLRVLPGYENTDLASVKLNMGNYSADVLAEQLEYIAAETDFVVMDFPPSLTGTAVAGIAAANHILIPTQLAQLSLNSVQKTTNTIRRMAKFNNAQIMGIVPMMYQRGSNGLLREHKAVLDILKGIYGGLVWDNEGVPLSTLWKEASGVGETVFSYAPKNHAVLDHAWRLIARVLQEV